MVQKCLVNIILKGTIFRTIGLKRSQLKINLMFNVDTTVKNNQTSLFRQQISRHLWKQVTLVILTLLYLTPRIYFL